MFADCHPGSRRRSGGSGNIAAGPAAPAGHPATAENGERQRSERGRLAEPRAWIHELQSVGGSPQDVDRVQETEGQRTDRRRLVDEGRSEPVDAFLLPPTSGGHGGSRHPTGGALAEAPRREYERIRSQHPWLVEMSRWRQLPYDAEVTISGGNRARVTRLPRRASQFVDIFLDSLARLDVTGTQDGLLRISSSTRPRWIRWLPT